VKLLTSQFFAKYLLPGVLIVALLGGCALLPSGRSQQIADDTATPTPIPTAIVPRKPTYTVQQGEVIKELTFSGRISPVVEEELFFRASGRVRAVYVKRNQMVTKDTLLAELEIDVLERELASAKLEFEQATTLLEAAKRELEFDLRITRINLEMEQIKLADLQSKTPPDPEAIALQQKQVELAEIALERKNQGVDVNLTTNYERAKLNVEKLEAAIRDSQIHALFDGQLLSVSLTPGQGVEAFQKVVSLADITSLEVSADLLSDQMSQLVEEMSVKVVLVSRPGDALTGKIRQLPYPYGSGGKGISIEDQDKSTRFSLDQTAQELGFQLGDLVRVTAELERKQDVLWLPPQALRVFDGRRFAVVQEGDVQRRVDVTVGIQTEERVEIEAGLELGQVVVGQ
jgi:multidrug efflux pump subunit AcrA (membrane-fusion protein)